MRKCKVFIEKSEYGYSAYIGDTPLEFGCIGEGKTVEETIADFLGTFEAMKQDYIAAGNKFEDVDIEFCYDTASFLSEYAGIFSLSGLEKITESARHSSATSCTEDASQAARLSTRSRTVLTVLPKN